MPTLQLTALELPFSSPEFILSRYFLFALIASLAVFAVVRLAKYVTSSKSSTLPIAAKPEKKQLQHQESAEPASSVSASKGAVPASASSSPSTSVVKKSKWTWGWFTLESLPMTLPQNQNRVIGQGVGVNSRPQMRTVVPPPPPPSAASQVVKQAAVHAPQPRRGLPIFDRPLPAIYQTQYPVSMAKMIMSRHTFRRPSGYRPPPPTNSSVPQHPSSRRYPSTMV